MNFRPAAVVYWAGMGHMLLQYYFVPENSTHELIVCGRCVRRASSFVPDVLSIVEINLA